MVVELKGGERKMKGLFEKRAYTKQEIESLIQSRWKETFVNMKDVDEARKEFPWQPPLVIKNCPPDVAKAIQWFLKWFGGEE